ncbi:ferric-chelate reductase Frp1 [Recurvomyces mirabilis]|uniref:Ferric-chelate reductase Frp1 n=1 Tax=Recurvomyces mirabilis TaxID=574656 RepID=A0AAE0WJF0_9PEZI|nr:ferric-chelate reductase Frp1 [Recurvomyces mirabilis]KAK5155012.1 ferric-chelate reductase Frp1 [Recurvomyces mirabilis]
MDMSGSGMDMGGGMDMGSAPLNATGVDFTDPDQASTFLAALLNDDELKVIGNAYARYFWYGVAVVVAVAAVFNWMRYLILQMRLRSAARREDMPARPKGVFARWFATITALVREATYLDFTPAQVNARFKWFKLPTSGQTMLLLAYLAFVLALEFANDSVQGAQFWQARGVRAGWLAVAQVPLIVLLVGKNNLFTLTTGVSYERLNIIHRWSSRVMLLLAIFHFAFQSRAWSQFPGLMELEWSTDSCPPTGIAAFALLLWMNLTTLAPLRYWSYEFFVWQHLITFFGFIIAIVYHLPSTATWSRIYIYVPVALYIIDRMITTAWWVWNNKRTSRATLTRLNGDVTKITMRNSTIKRWGPGSYMLLTLPGQDIFGWAQSHPATIMSTPTSHDGQLVFILKSHKGFTKSIMNYANTSTEALLSRGNSEAETGEKGKTISYRAIINGPYGGHHADFAAFDSICLIAGSTGVTFTLAVLQDIAERAANLGKKLPVRRIHLIWCNNQEDRAKWVAAELNSAVEKLAQAGIETIVTVHVTCDSALTNQTSEPKACGCKCDKSAGPCCCVTITKDTEEIAEETKKGDGEPKVTIQSSARSSDSMRSAASVKDDRVVVKRSWLPCGTLCSGRPDFREILTNMLDGAQGESGVAVCGPHGMGAMIRRDIVKLSDERAIHKGTGAQGCYLHVESFS